MGYFTEFNNILNIAAKAAGLLSHLKEVHALLESNEVVSLTKVLYIIYLFYKIKCCSIGMSPYPSPYKLLPNQLLILRFALETLSSSMPISKYSGTLNPQGYSPLPMFTFHLIHK